jgi:hypothetical protein
LQSPYHSGTQERIDAIRQTVGAEQCAALVARVKPQVPGFLVRAVQERALTEDRYDNQSASGSILILVAAAVLSALTFTGLMNATLLLGFTFVLGLGAILANPAWQAVNTELVLPDELPAAVTLSSVSYNLARGEPSTSRPRYRCSGTGRSVPPQRHRLPVRGRRALWLAPRAPQSGPARRTPGRRHEVLVTVKTLTLFTLTFFELARFKCTLPLHAQQFTGLTASQVATAQSRELVPTHGLPTHAKAQNSR